MKLRYIILILLALLNLSHANPINSKKLDSSQPIDITADNLDVDQYKNTATFIGNVVAVQGKVTIHSDKMVVFYEQEKSKNNNDSSETFSQQIKKIENFGHVKMVNSDSISYSDHGEYDIKKEMLYLTHNVKLIKNNNVLYGDKLVYNMATGKSKLLSNNNQKDKKGRVKAVIIPKSKNK